MCPEKELTGLRPPGFARPGMEAKDAAADRALDLDMCCNGTV